MTLSAETPPRSSERKKIALRRWRNLMITAYAQGQPSKEELAYLEKMRRELGVSLPEAHAMVEEYKEKGGSYFLFGDRAQRIELLRDAICMMLADGQLDDRQRHILQQIAARIGLSPATLERHIAECRLSLSEGTSPRDSARLSARIFRRIVQSSSLEEEKKYLDSYATLPADGRRALELEILQHLVQQPEASPEESTRTRRHKRVYLEDQQCAQWLIEHNLLTEAQIQPFREEQEREFQERGLVVSFLTEMARQGAIGKKELQQAREAIREKLEEEPPPLHTTLREKNASACYRRVTLDHTFYATEIILSGFLDHATVPALESTFRTVLALEGEEGKFLVLNLTDVTYLSSRGIGLILTIRHEVCEHWGDLRIVGAQESIREGLQVLGAEMKIQIFDTVEEALWSFLELAQLDLPR